ncbi:MAG: hypothetical protein KAI45_12110 [Melioribacteraceae bacterium]|nr:hypothetical protein [Melioribacteraceae bacterium]
MKNFKLVLFFLILLTQMISAQEHFSKGRWGMQGSKIAELEKIKLIEELQLDEETTLRFFSRRNSHQGIQKEIAFKRDSLLTQLNKKIDEDDNKVDYQKEINEILNIDKQLLDERVRFFKSLDDILSYEQIAELLIFEKKFKSEIRKQILRQGRGRRGQNPTLD